MSQLTLIALILLVAFLWKFGPWFRQQRILSYDFPIGWWRHVAVVAPDCDSWSLQRKRQLEDYVRLFVDRIEFVVADDLQEEFEIRHRVAFATQAFLLFEHQPFDPLRHIEKFYVQRFSNESKPSEGLPRLFWEERDLNFITMFEISTLAGELDSNELTLLPTIVQNKEDRVLLEKEIAKKVYVVLKKHFDS